MLSHMLEGLDQVPSTLLSHPNFSLVSIDHPTQCVE
jgi:hypothetical protein